MRIFLSVASPDRHLAEEVAYALRIEKHIVFLDKDDLPPGQSFHQQIREGIQHADLAVFFVSKHSIQKGRYTLTELDFIKDKWRNPSGRVLPVKLDDLPMKMIPSYLRSVSVCEPTGNLAAEVSYQIARMAQKIRQLEGPGESDGAGAGGDIRPSPVRVPEAILGVLGFGLLAAVVSHLSNNKLAPELKQLLKLSGEMLMVSNGAVLSLLIGLAAVFFGVRKLAAFAAIAVGCVAASVFDAYCYDLMRTQLPIFYLTKSLIFAAAAGVVIPVFRMPSALFVLAASGAIVGLFASEYSQRDGLVIGETVFVSAVAMLLAFGDHLGAWMSGRMPRRSRGRERSGETAERIRSSRSSR